MLELWSRVEKSCLRGNLGSWAALREETKNAYSHSGDNEWRLPHDYIHTHSRTYAHTHMCACTHTHTCTCSQAHTHTRMHLHTYTHTSDFSVRCDELWF